MLKHIMLALGIAATSAYGQTLDPARLSGRWTGTGTFFKPELQEKAGPVRMTVEFADGKLVTGEVGGAKAQRAPVKSGRRLLQVTSKLQGVIGAAPELDKDTFVLLITTLSDSTASGEFHLKTNALYDPRMREGRVSLRRVSR